MTKSEKEALQAEEAENKRQFELAEKERIENESKKVGSKKEDAPKDEDKTAKKPKKLEGKFETNEVTGEVTRVRPEPAQ